MIDLSAKAYKDGDAWKVDKVSSTRTARRLMEGFVLVPDRLFAPSKVVESVAQQLATR